MDASTSGPAVSVHSAQTSTTASVQPTLKRTREVVETEFLAGEGESGPSGVQKKARTVSTEEPQALAEVAEDDEADFRIYVVKKRTE